MNGDDRKHDVDPDAFWDLIDLASEDRGAFVAALHSLDRKGLIRFAWTYEERASRLMQTRYQRHMAPGLSEDAQDDVARWVVEQGRDRYERVLTYPAEMPSERESGTPSPRVYYDADNVFEERFGEGLPPYGYDD